MMFSDVAVGQPRLGPATRGLARSILPPALTASVGAGPRSVPMNGQEGGKTYASRDECGICLMVSVFNMESATQRPANAAVASIA